MDLYLIRHAEAVDVGTNHVIQDCDRYLTQKGTKQAVNIAKWLKKTHVTFEQIWTSPWQRAFETAEIILKYSRINTEINMHSCLAPGNRFELLDLIGESNLKSVIIVGLEPFLGELVNYLVLGNTPLGIPLGKGSISKIKVKDPYSGQNKMEYYVSSKTITELTQKG